MAQQVTGDVDVRSLRRNLARLKDDPGEYTFEQIVELEEQILACDPEDAEEFQNDLMGAAIREQRRTIREGIATFLLSGTIALLSLGILTKLVVEETPSQLFGRILNQPLADLDAAFSLIILLAPLALLGLFSLYLLKRVADAVREIGLIRRFQAEHVGPTTITAYRNFRRNARSLNVSLRNRGYRMKFGSTKRDDMDRIAELSGIEREDLDRQRAVQAAYFLFENRYIQNEESMFIYEVLKEECDAFRQNHDAEKFLSNPHVQDYLFAAVE